MRAREAVRIVATALALLLTFDGPSPSLRLEAKLDQEHAPSRNGLICLPGANAVQR